MTAGPPATGCVDPDAAAAYVAHALEGAEAVAIEAHIDACADCRRLVSETARDTFDSEGALPGGILPRGARAGAYEIVEVLGAGNIGVVYRARDTRLGRMVALKSLREGADAAAEQAALLQEARAMARLAHPNIVAVHDLVEAGPRRFVAMELVAGKSARSWLEEAPRSWREILDVFLAAAEGLAAGHAAGVVHRDVKADNVLLGDDGRVRVADFGLARFEEAGAPEKPRPVGTPAYMAPEVRAGRAGDTASDQYAFCASLHEGLFGALPGEAPRRGADVPRRVRRALARGLREDPAHRWRDMAALLGALRAGRRDARGKWVMAASAATAIAATAAFFAHRAAGARAAMAACEAEATLAGVWDDARKVDVGRALLATGRPYAEDARGKVLASLDAWSRAYERERHEACAATWTQRRQPPAVLEARLSCLVDRRRHARAVIDELAHAEATTASNAVAASALGSPETCSPEAAQQAPAPDTITAAKLAPIRDLHARVHALVETGHPKDAFSPATEALALADAAADPRARAEALVQLGTVEALLSSFDVSEKHLVGALDAAERAGDRRARAQAWVQLLHCEHLRGRYDRLDLYRSEAERAVDAAGREPALRSRMLHLVGTSLAARGERDEAKEVLARALAADPGAPEWARGTMLESIALADEIAGDVDAALGPLAEARALVERGLGSAHPRVAHSTESIAVAWLDALQPAQALPEMRRAVAAFEAALGPRHRTLAIAYDVLGFVELELGHLDAAVEHHGRALAMWQELGVEHPRNAFSHLGLALVHLAKGEAALAVARAEEARSAGERLADPKDRAWIASTLARALAAARKGPARQRALAEEARDLYREALRSPRDDRELARAEALLGVASTSAEASAALRRLR